MLSPSKLLNKSGVISEDIVNVFLDLSKRNQMSSSNFVSYFEKSIPDVIEFIENASAHDNIKKGLMNILVFLPTISGNNLSRFHDFVMKNPDNKYTNYMKNCIGIRLI